MLLEIDHGIGFTTKHAITAAEVELVMYVVVRLISHER
jgi:hypothetical protein